MAPTLVASRTALPPEGAVPSKGGLSAGLAPTLFTSCNALPPEGALRLRSGEAGSAALAGEEGGCTLLRVQLG
jgi:hypothetical protein